MNPITLQLNNNTRLIIISATASTLVLGLLLFLRKRKKIEFQDITDTPFPNNTTLEETTSNDKKAAHVSFQIRPEVREIQAGAVDDGSPVASPSAFRERSVSAPPSTSSPSATPPVENGEGEASASPVKKKKDLLREKLIEGVNIIMGDKAGKFVESVFEASKGVKVPAMHKLMNSEIMASFFESEVMPILRDILQKSKIPNISGATTSPVGDLHYEVSNLSLSGLSVDPALRCDMVDGGNSLQVRFTIKSAVIKNIAWRCWTTVLKEKGSATASISNSHCVFQFDLDLSMEIPRLVIKRATVELNQFSLEIKGSKASWAYNFLSTFFNSKIKSKLQEEIDLLLSKKCATLENTLNFIAVKKLSKILFKKEKNFGSLGNNNNNSTNNIMGSIETKITTDKKCFLHTKQKENENVVILNLESIANIEELKVRFFDELGILDNASLNIQSVVVKFQDAKGDLISATKRTTIEQILQHADSLHFFANDM